MPERIVLVSVRRTEYRHYFPLFVEKRGIQGYELVPCYIFLADTEPLVLELDVIVGFLVHSGTENHFFEHLRGGGPEDLASGSI